MIDVIRLEFGKSLLIRLLAFEFSFLVTHQIHNSDINNGRFYFIKNQKQPPEVFCEEGVLRIFTKFTVKHLFQSLFFNKVAGLMPDTCSSIKKETLVLVFPCEFSEISKNNFSYRALLVAASKKLKQALHFL